MVSLPRWKSFLFGPPEDFYKTLLFLFLLSFALRALFCILFSYPIISDSKDYDSFARGLLHYHTFGENGFPSSDRPPLYPSFLALLYLLPFPDIPTAFVFQILISSLTVLLIYSLGRKYLGKKGGLIAGLLACFTPDYLFFSSALLTETLFLFLFLLGLWLYLYEGQKLYHPIGGGIFFGLAALTRPEGFIFSSFILWGNTIFSSEKIKNLKRTLLTFLFSLITISPWVIRNTSLHRQLCFITTTGGGVFWMGNNPKGKGGYYWTKEDNPLLNPDLDEIERDRTAYKLALKNITSHPLMWLRSLGLKTAHLLSPIPDPSKVFTLKYPLAKIAVSLYYMLFTELLFILAFAGMVRKLDSPFLRLSRFLIIIIAAFYILVMVEQRFRAPLLPFLTIFASGSVLFGVRKTLKDRRFSILGFLILQLSLLLFALFSVENRYLRALSIFIDKIF